MNSDAGGAPGLSALSLKTSCLGSFTSNVSITTSVLSIVPSRGLAPQLRSGKGRLRKCPGPGGTLGSVRAACFGSDLIHTGVN